MTSLLDVYVAAFLEVESGGEPATDVDGHLNSAFHVGGFHAGSHVDGVTPHVVEELARATTPATTGPAARPMPLVLTFSKPCRSTRPSRSV